MPILKALLDLFRSVPLAIILLSGLALGILTGVLIPQEGLVEVARLREQFGWHYTWMSAMGLFRMFSSPAFLALEVLFFFNLLLGSFLWLRPAFRAALQTSLLKPENIQAMSLNGSVDCSFEALLAQLKRLGYRLRRVSDDGTMFYASQGDICRLGPAVAHVGILLLLVASVYGAFTGFKAQKLLAPGQSFTLAQADTLTRNVPEPFWLGSIPTYRIRVDDFNVVFYPNDPETPQQYYCKISVFKTPTDAKPFMHKTLSVNTPLVLGDFSAYQASYIPSGELHLTLNGKPKVVKTTMQFQGRDIALLPLIDVPGYQDYTLIVFPFYQKHDAGVQQTHIACFLRRAMQPLQQKDAQGRPVMPPNVRIGQGEVGTLQQLNIGFVRPIYKTGLQLKKAPEVPWVYTAFVLIIVGAFACLPAQRQIWGATCDKETSNAPKWYLGGKTNKGQWTLNQHFETLLTKKEELTL